MVDPTLGGRIDYREALANVDFESLFEGTRFEGDEDGVAATVGGELGEALGRVLGAAVGYIVGAVFIGSSVFGDGGDESAEDESEDIARGNDGDGEAKGGEDETEEAKT